MAGQPPSNRKKDEQGQKPHEAAHENDLVHRIAAAQAADDDVLDREDRDAGDKKENPLERRVLGRGRQHLLRHDATREGHPNRGSGPASSPATLSRRSAARPAKSAWQPCIFSEAAGGPVPAGRAYHALRRSFFGS
jgi:hypothetical protein